MNIQLPVFAGFTNYAICRSDDPRMTSCYVIDTGIKTIVKLRQGSGKERQGKARKGKDGER